MVSIYFDPMFEKSVASWKKEEEPYRNKASKETILIDASAKRVTPESVQVAYEEKVLDPPTWVKDAYCGWKNHERDVEMLKKGLKDFPDISNRLRFLVKMTIHEETKLMKECRDEFKRYCEDESKNREKSFEADMAQYNQYQDLKFFDFVAKERRPFVESRPVLRKRPRCGSGASFISAFADADAEMSSSDSSNDDTSNGDNNCA